MRYLSIDAHPVGTKTECSFLWTSQFEDAKTIHLKDFLKVVDSLDLDVANKERTRLHLSQFSLRDQASNWLERLPAGSISTWEDLTTLIPTTLSTAWKIPGKLLSTMRPRIPIEAGYEAKEAGSVKSSATENKDHEMTVEKEEEFKKLKKKPKKKRIITGTL
ncbi:hypothetical protein Tco_0261939 [Tanacetum coccineum]